MNKDIYLLNGTIDLFVYLLSYISLNIHEENVNITKALKGIVCQNMYMITEQN